jgi:hypothetical protein
MPLMPAGIRSRRSPRAGKPLGNMLPDMPAARIARTRCAGSRRIPRRARAARLRREIAWRLDRHRDALERAQYVCDPRRHLEGRNQFTAMQFDAAIVAGMQGRMDDTHVRCRHCHRGR